MSQSSSGSKRSHDSLLGSQHNDLGSHLWGCDRAWFPLWVCPPWPPCRHPTVAYIGWLGKCVMAVVGEEGRRDDVMREDQEQHAEAVTVPTCVSAPFSRRFFSRTFATKWGKKITDPKRWPSFQYVAVYYWYRSRKHTGTRSIFLSNCAPVYI